MKLMTEERELNMEMQAIPVIENEMTLEIEQLMLKTESADTSIIQLKGKLIRNDSTSDRVVVALHTKNNAGEYVHLQQYEFEYSLDQTSQKEIDLSVLVLSEVLPNQSYDIEIKLLTEQSNQQWQTIQRYNKLI